MPAYYIVDAKGNVLAFPVGVADVSSLNADNLTSGTVPLARLAGITNAQIDAAAAIAYSKLALTGDIVDADIASAAAIAWSKLSKSGSSLADLATRSAADLASGNLAVARLGNGVTSKTTAADTGTVNDWAPTIAGNTYIEWSGASDATFTGLSSSGVTAGTMVFFKNTGSHNAFFSNANANSSAANQFTNRVTSAATPVAPTGFIVYVFNGTNWQLLVHEQGMPITPAFSAGDYTASGSMTWTVTSGEVSVCAYYLEGNQLTVFLDIEGATIGGVASTQLRRAIPGGFSFLSGNTQDYIWTFDNVTAKTGVALAVSGEAFIRFYRDITLAANWELVTGNNFIRGCHIQVQVS